MSSSFKFAVVYQISTKLVHAFGLQTPITVLNVQCAVAKQRPLPWQTHDSERVGDMMECYHSIFVQIGPLVVELWHFQYFPTWRPSAILNFKIFGHVTVIVFLICCCDRISSKSVHMRSASRRP